MHTIVFRILFCQATWIILQVHSITHTHNLMWTVRGSNFGSPHLLAISGDPIDWLNSSIYDARFIRFFNTDIRFTGLAFDFREQYVAVSDPAIRMILKIPLEASNATDANIDAQIFHRGVSQGVGQVAIDWIAKNLYWVDGLYNWVAVRAINSTDESHMKVLFHDHIDEPQGLAVHPLKGYLFWTDSGVLPKIERSTLGGTNRKVLIYRGLIIPQAITIDFTTDLIYFVDQGRATVETCDLDGGSRAVLLIRPGTTLHGISLYQNYVFVAEQRIPRVFVYFNNGTFERALSMRRGDDPYNMIMYAAESQPMIANPCDQMGCSDICALTPDGPMCICRNGFQAKGIDCIGFHNISYESIIFTNGSDICSLSMIDIEVDLAEPVCFLTNMTDVSAIASDVNAGVIFFAINNVDIEDNFKLYEYILGTDSATEIFSNSLNVTDLTYDWINNNLYWIREGDQRICILDRNTNTGNMIKISTGIPSTVAVDPLNSRLFWISPSKQQIIQSNLDVSNVTVIFKSDLMVMPRHLQYDNTKDTLIWTDTGRTMSFKIGSTTSFEHVSTDLTDNTMALAYKDYLYWFIGDTPPYSLHVNDFSSSQPLGFMDIPSELPFRDAFVFALSMQPNSTGACEIDNGMCDQICLPNNGSRTCLCEFGFELSPDGSKCTTALVPDNFLLTSDFYHNNIYQVDLGTCSNSSCSIARVPIGIDDKPTSVAYSKNADTIYWTDVGYHLVKKSFLNGTAMDTVLNFGSYFADRVAIDASTENLYFTANSVVGSGQSSYIGVAKADGSSEIKLVNNLDRPRAISLYPSKGFFFWTDHGTPQISRASMDGSNRITVVNVDIEWPNGMDIDYDDDKLYWCDGFTDIIDFSNLDGSNRTRVLQLDNVHLMSVVVSGQYLYYVAWSLKEIVRIDKYNGRGSTPIVESIMFGRLDGLYISTAPVNINTLCASNNGGCSHLCLPTPTGRTCKCSKGVLLETDGQTCIGTTTCPQLIGPTSHTGICTRQIGVTCPIKCNYGYKEIDGTTLEVTCQNDATWNMHVGQLCQRQTCPESFRYGRMAIGCIAEAFRECTYVCDIGYHSNISGMVYLECTAFGNWSINTDMLCTRNDCPKRIGDGYVSTGCNLKPFTTCSYTCDAGYHPATGVNMLSCSHNGQWSPDTKSLCKATTCPRQFLHGSIAVDCLGQVFQNCDFVCGVGYKKSDFVGQLQCNDKGQWSKDLSSLCIDITSVRTMSPGGILPAGTGNNTGHSIYQAGVQSNKVPVYVIVIVVIVLVLIIAAVVLAAVFYIRRRRGPLVKGRYESDPSYDLSVARYKNTGDDFGVVESVDNENRYHQIEFSTPQNKVAAEPSDPSAC